MTRHLVRGLSLLALAAGPSLSGCQEAPPEPRVWIVSVVPTTDMSTYTALASVTVSWSGFNNTTNNRVALGWPSPYSCGSYHYSHTLGTGTGSGMYTFTNVGAAPYDARFYESGSTCAVDGRSAAFDVNPPGSPSITVDQATYDYGEDVIIDWTNFQGCPDDDGVRDPRPGRKGPSASRSVSEAVGRRCRTTTVSETLGKEGTGPAREVSETRPGTAGDSAGYGRPGIARPARRRLDALRLPGRRLCQRPSAGGRRDPRPAAGAPRRPSAGGRRPSAGQEGTGPAARGVRDPAG